jgi:hypothetical protein
MSATPPNYQFPTPLRYLLWILGGLVFYAQFMTFLLGDIKIDAEPGSRILSAWITLLDLQQNAPAKILIPSRERIVALVPQTLRRGCWKLLFLRLRWNPAAALLWRRFRPMHSFQCRGDAFHVVN